MKKYLYLYIIIMIISLSCYGQNKEISDLIATADIAFEEKNYYGAAKLYEDALKYNHRMYDIVWSAAQAYRMDNDYINAAKHYRFLTDKIPEKYPEAIYYYAQMLKANEEYIRAQYFFQQYLKINDIDSLNATIIRAKEEILNCEFGWEMYSSPNGFNLIQCDSVINSIYSDFSTGFLNDSVLVFASIKPVNDSVKDYKSKLYSIDFFDDSREAILMDSGFNIPNYDISNAHFSNNGNKIFFTISDYYKRGNTYIYTSEKINNKWNEPEKLESKINPKGYNSTHPYLIEREKKTDILIWSSNREGGEGGYDLYYCEILNDGSWGFVRNLGRPIFDDARFIDFMDTTSSINTSGNEITPYFNVEDSLLYFSSDWYQNMGGYDIFSVKGNFRVWDSLNNIGYPLNSAQNDFYFKIYPNSYLAFLSSNRKSAFVSSHQSCCNDLFYYELDKEINEVVIEEQRIELLTSRTKLLVPIALYFHNDQPNANSWDTITELNYSTTYFDYMDLQEDYRKKFSRGLPKTERISAIDSVDYYFSYFVQDNYNKLLEFTNLMKELLESGQKIVVTIKGYTSPLNTVEYNNNLAKRRISSLVNYFNEFEYGYFIPYVESGMIEYSFVAFGKTLSDGKVSDDPNDPRNSIYNPAASRERRIEIIAVSVEELKEQNSE